MGTEDLANALRRAETVLQRRPDMGLQQDAAASARWRSGTRVVTSHANGAHVETDMSQQLGGTGDCVSPGWLFRAGLGACAATSIVMAAARAGIALTAIEVQVTSRSDARGLLGLAEHDGTPVYPGPNDLGMHVRIGAIGVGDERLHALVDDALRCSPIPCAIRTGAPIALQVEILAR